MEREKRSGTQGQGGTQSSRQGNGDSEQESRGTTRGEEMGLGRWNLEHGPFEVLRRYGREMDRMFDNWRYGGGMGMPFSRWPAIEMFERDNEVIVRVELPGMQREDVHVRTLGHTLVIEGERRDENRDTRGGNVNRSEWSYGRFTREIMIPPDVDASKLTARMRHGVLELTLPYREERRAREIEIQGESAGTGRPAEH